jgi:hypothetical protein
LGVNRMRMGVPGIEEQTEGNRPRTCAVRTMVLHVASSMLTQRNDRSILMFPGSLPPQGNIRLQNAMHG